MFLSFSLLKSLLNFLEIYAELFQANEKSKQKYQHRDLFLLKSNVEKHIKLTSIKRVELFLNLFKSK